MGIDQKVDVVRFASGARHIPHPGHSGTTLTAYNVVDDLCVRNSLFVCLCHSEIKTVPGPLIFI